jgi:hypothetical protein
MLRLLFTATPVGASSSAAPPRGASLVDGKRRSELKPPAPAVRRTFLTPAPTLVGLVPEPPELLPPEPLPPDPLPLEGGREEPLAMETCPPDPLPVPVAMEVRL